MASNNPHHQGNPGLLSKGKNNNGKEKITAPPRALNIVWGGDSRYWNIPNDDKSPAELLQVCWLEVTGSVGIEDLDPSKTYEVGFNVSLTPDAFGWNNSPVYIMVKMGKEGKWAKHNLNQVPNQEFAIKGKAIKPELVKRQDPEARKIYFGLYEVWTGKWKGGLKIHSAFIEEGSQTSDTKLSSFKGLTIRS